MNARRVLSVAGSAAAVVAAVCGFGQSPPQTVAPAATAPGAGTPSCGPAVFLSLEQGKLVAVDWVGRTASHVHTRVVETQSLIIDATIELRPDDTAAN